MQAPALPLTPSDAYTAVADRLRAALYSRVAPPPPTPLVSPSASAPATAGPPPEGVPLSIRPGIGAARPHSGRGACSAERGHSSLHPPTPPVSWGARRPLGPRRCAGGEVKCARQEEIRAAADETGGVPVRPPHARARDEAKAHLRADFVRVVPWSQASQAHHPLPPHSGNGCRTGRIPLLLRMKWCMK